MEIRVESVLEKKSELINKTKLSTQEHSTKKRSCQTGILIKISCKKLILPAFHRFPWHTNVGHSSLWLGWPCLQSLSLGRSVVLTHVIKISSDLRCQKMERCQCANKSLYNYLIILVAFLTYCFPNFSKVGISS